MVTKIFKLDNCFLVKIGKIQMAKNREKNIHDKRLKTMALYEGEGTSTAKMKGEAVHPN